MNFGSVLDIKDLNIVFNFRYQKRTKGKGFTGMIKHYGFSELSTSHGVSLNP